MAAVQTMKARPALAALAAAVVLIAVGMVVPVSYDRVTGHDVSITLAGANFTPDQIAPTAKEMKAKLGAEGVQVDAMDDSGVARFVFHTTLPERSRAEAARKAGAFVKEPVEPFISKSCPGRSTAARRPRPLGRLAAFFGVFSFSRAHGVVHRC